MNVADERVTGTNCKTLISGPALALLIDLRDLRTYRDQFRIYPSAAKLAKRLVGLALEDDILRPASSAM